MTINKLEMLRVLELQCQALAGVIDLHRRNIRKMTSKIISLGIVLMVGNTLLNEIDNQLYLNRPKTF